MFKTKALSSFKSIFPPIHHPSPLTERESQRLLDGLKTSFRQQLDREHGFDYVDKPFATSKFKYLASAPTPGLVLPSSSATSTAAPPPSQHVLQQQKSVGRPTDRHLHAILDNPLFRQSKAPELHQSSLESRKAVFHSAVSKGLMTTRRACGFLLAIRKDILASSHTSPSEGMAASGAALLVVQWLRASGLERSLKFVKDDQFLKQLLDFMVCEGLDGLAWTWMERLAAREMRVAGAVATAEAVLTETSEKSALSHLERMLSYFVCAKAYAFELNGACHSMFKAKALFENHSVPYQYFNAAWRTLAWQMTGESFRHSKLPEDQFESFVDLHRHLSVMPMHLAHLDLHHPTKPSSDLALEFLGDEAAWKAKLAASFKSRHHTVIPPYVKKFASVTLDTVQNLTDQGRFDKAEWALSIVRNHLSPLNLTHRGLAMS